MLKMLRRIFLRHRSGESSGLSAVHEQGEGVRGESVPSPYLLLSRRVTDSMGSIPGFREIYHCTRCHDCFVLGWHARSSPFIQECEVVQEMPPALAGKGSAGATVFCPKCMSDYAMYGLIQHPEVPVETPESACVYESFDYPFPPDVRSDPAGTIKIGALIVEKIIILLTGEFPEGMDVREFAYSGVNEIVLSRHGGGCHISEHGGIRLHLLRVSNFVDETYWLMPFLQNEIYRTPSRGGILLTYGVVNLEPPLGQGLICAMLSSKA